MTEQPQGIRAFDLVAPIKTMVPLRSPLLWGADLTAARARAEAEKKALRARLEAEETAARAEWKALCDRVAATPALAAVLTIHNPWCGPYDDHVGCAECIEADSYESTRNVDWPCDTYKAIKENTP